MISLLLHAIFALVFTWLGVQAARGKYKPSKIAVVILLAIVALDSYAVLLKAALYYSQSV